MTKVEMVLVTLMGLQTAAQIIVNLTPTPKDDEIVAKVYRVIEALAGIWTALAKQ